jgi:hypothetical protein
MTKPEAIDEFRKLVAQYGVQWTAKVPASAYERLAEINKVLDESDRRLALGLSR